MLKLIISCALCLFILTSHAQEITPEPEPVGENNPPINLGISEVSAFLDTDVLESTLGQPIPVTLTVEMPIGYTVSIWEPDSWFEQFQVIDSSEIEIQEQGSIQIQKQELSIVAWELDLITTGETFVTYQTPTGQQFRTPITSITINITATRPENDVTLRPSIPAIDIHYIPIYLYFVPIVILIVAALILRQIRFNRRFQIALANPNSPIQKAIIELKHLLDMEASVEDVFLATSDEIRIYITEQFNIRAIDMTTAELLSALSTNTIFTTSLRNNIQRLLQEADLVKFANHIPTSTPEQVVQYAIRWIEEAEKARLTHD